MSKRTAIIGPCFCFAATLLVAAGTAHGAATISVPAAISAEPGESFNVPISLDNGTGVLGYYLNFTYNSDVVEYVSISAGSLTGAWGAPMVNAQTGSLSVVATHPIAVSGFGTLAVLHLRVKAGVSNGSASPLRLDEAELNDGAIAVTVANGMLTVSATMEVRVPVTMSAGPGQEITLPISVDDSAGVLGYYVEVTFNGALLEYASANAGTLTTSWGTPIANGGTAGKVTIAGTSSQALGAGSGSLAVLRLRFKPTATPGQSSLIHLAAVELNDAAIATTISDGVVTVSDVAVSNVKRVRLGAAAPGDGTYISPFPTIVAGLDAVSSGGTVVVEAGGYLESVSAGPWRITKAARLEALNGTVRIDATLGGKTQRAAATTASAPGAKTLSMKTLLGTLRASLLASSAALDTDTDTESNVNGGAIHASTMPFTRTEDGDIAASQNSIIALRLRAENTLDEDSFWAALPKDCAAATDIEFRPAADGASNDYWVLFKPHEAWLLDDKVLLEAGAANASEAAQFQIQAGQDAAEITITQTEPATYHIAPERVYDTPQRVWLPIPGGVDPAQLRLEYFQAEGENKGWHPAEQVAGWIVPESEAIANIEGTNYYGFLARHAAIARLVAQ